MAGERQSANLADLLERILDKGIVIVGDVRVNLLDIELLTIKLRLLVASVDRAREMGIDWWEHDPSLSSKARTGHSGGDGRVDGAADRELLEENRRLRERLAALEAGDGAAAAADTQRSGDSERSGARRTEGKEAGS
ncbi:gas vesicle protein [Actinomadura montaniterrae]|uniref:Gas vesicle protein n=1 Tax=Actinomadura montaniterrae TaxID=1803903 RepID=A0A6L3VKE1_9ACTN|nr:gas vesicle protein [Actinomadura montaniterrae]KAB2371735.1 gas vesicle protein [Actinomadura montaniterrae]